MAQARSCDTHNVDSIYRRLRRSMMRYVARYFRRPQDIEDVVQEAFVRVIEAQQARGARVNDAYFYRTARNLALNRLARSEHRLTDTVGDLLEQTVILEGPTLEEQFESSERFELFCRAVRQLPIKCRRVFILRRIYGLSHKEIAERMGISVKTVEVHLTKAIVRCTEYMEADGAMGTISDISRYGKVASGRC